LDASDINGMFYLTSRICMWRGDVHFESTSQAGLLIIFFSSYAPLYYHAHPIHDTTQGLTCLKNAGVAHRDMSPENLMVHDGQVYIIDLGHLSIFLDYLRCLDFFSV
jgi:serine/threonine protein kinase